MIECLSPSWLLLFVLWMIAQRLMFLGKEGGILTWNRKKMLSLLTCNKKYFNITYCFLSPFKIRYNFCDYLFIYFARYVGTSTLYHGTHKNV